MNIMAYLIGWMPGAGEMAIILGIMVLFFGGKKLPQLARSVGASLTEFKKGKKEGVEPTSVSTVVAEASADGQDSTDEKA